MFISIFAINECVDTSWAISNTKSKVFVLLMKMKLQEWMNLILVLYYSIGLKTDDITLILSFGCRMTVYIWFWRQLNSWERIVKLDLDHTLLMRWQTYTVNSEFIVKAKDTNQNQIDTLISSKEFTPIKNKKVWIYKVDGFTSPDQSRWEVWSLTPLVDGSCGKVSLAVISFLSLSDISEQGELFFRLLSNELDNLYTIRDSLPYFFTRLRM